MTKIHIKEKTYLTTHANLVGGAGQEFSAAIAGVYSGLNASISTSQGDAIEAFINKINTLASQVFTEFPNVLSEYQTTLSEYDNAISNEGFSSELVKSEDSAIESHKSWMTKTGDTIELELMTTLKSALITAENALRMDPYPVTLDDIASTQLTSVTDSFIDELDVHKRDRQSKHNNLVSAKTAFDASMKELGAKIQYIQSAIRTAKYINKIPAATVSSLLQNGSLNTQTIAYIDLIQESNDPDMLVAVLSDAPFKKMGNVDASSVSNAMMFIAYKKVYDEFDAYYNIENADPVHLENISQFIETITSHSSDFVSIYMEKLSIVSELHATKLLENVKKLVPELPQNATDEQIAAYRSQMEQLKSDTALKVSPEMEKIKLLGSLFDGIYTLEMGEDTNKILQTNGLSFADGEVRLAVKNGDSGYVTFTEEEIVRNSKDISRLGELEEKKKEALKEFSNELLKAGADLLLPGWASVAAYVITDLVTDAMDSIDGVVSGMVDGHAETALGDGDWGKITGSIGKAWSSIIDFTSSVSEYTKEQESINESLGGSLFDIDGVSVSEGDSIIDGVYQPEYDIQTMLSMEDLNKNGLRGYYVRNEGYNGENLIELSKKLNQAVAEGTIDQPTLAYLLGNSNKTVQDIGYSELLRIFQLRSGEGLQSEVIFDSDLLNSFAQKNSEYFSSVDSF